jgi:HEAT repeat protein
MLVWQALRLYPTISLIHFLHDPNGIVSTTAARELQTRPEAKMVFDYAVQLLRSAKENEREIGVFLLGQIGTPDRPLKAESIPLLEAMCTDVDPDVRSTALASLGHLGAKESEATIRKAVFDDHPEVRETASEVLEWLELDK